MTLLVFNSAIIVVPIFLGRALFNSVPLLPITHGIKCNGKKYNQGSVFLVLFFETYLKSFYNGISLLTETA